MLYQPGVPETPQPILILISCSIIVVDARIGKLADHLLHETVGPQYFQERLEQHGRNLLRRASNKRHHCTRL